MLNFLRKEENNSDFNAALGRLRGQKKLNIGCGTDYKKGWVNIDNNSDNNIEHLDINWDLRKPLPIGDESVDYIYNEHFIEHLSVEEGQSFIRDAHRVLKKGGILRIATPDLAVTVDKYLNVPLEDDSAIKRFNMDFIKTRAERINIGFRWWGHQWIYDWEELNRRIHEAAIWSSVVRVGLWESKHPTLRNLETRQESTLIAEATK